MLIDLLTKECNICRLNAELSAEGIKDISLTLQIKKVFQLERREENFCGPQCAHTSHPLVEFNPPLHNA